MIDEKWIWAERIFHEAIELPADEREAFLHAACASEPERIPEIFTLIEAFEKDSGFLESAGFGAGLAVMGTQAPPVSLTGTGIGQYEVGEKIGEGGMGEVYDAFDTRLNRRVALKFLANTFVSNNIAKRQLIREAQSAAMLNHTNICSIYDIEHIGEHDFIAMEYIGGMTLAEAIKTGQIDPAQLPRIIKQIVQAAAFAHSHGILHRDLKPANIMIDPDAEGKITVLDFGLAKMVKPEGGLEGRSVASQNGLIIGTVSYMSPEQLRGERLDYQSDIFSIGVTLYELVSGKNPFARASQVDTIAAVLGDEPPRLTEVDPRISTDMSEIVAKCLEKDKQKRFQSTAEILVSIENASDRRKRKNRPIGRTQIAIAAVLFLMIFVTVIGFLFVRTPASTTHSLAVLPIVNANTDTTYLSEGLTDNITSSLSGFKYLRITPSTIAAGFKDPELDPVTVGKQLQVDFVMRSQVKEFEGGPMLEATLINTESGTQIWKKQFSLDKDSVVNMQEELPVLVAYKLQVEVNDDELTRLKKRQAKVEEANQELYRGRYYLNRRGDDRKNVDKSIDSFEKATKLEPTFARAWAGLAEAYVTKSLPAYGSLTPAEAMGKAKYAVKEALSLDSESSEAYTANALIKLRYDWDFPAAEASFQRAIDINQDYAPAHYWYSYELALTGDYDRAMAEAQRSKDLDPLSINSESNIARIYYYEGKNDAAIDIVEKMFKDRPDNNNLAYMLGVSYLREGRNQEALDIFEKFYPKDQAYFAAQLGYAYGRLNRKSDSLRIIGDLESLEAGGKIIPAQEKAIIYLGIGEADKAFSLFQKSCTERFPAVPFVLKEFFFDPYRNDARFTKLKACITTRS